MRVSQYGLPILVRLMLHVTEVEGPLDSPCWIPDYKTNYKGYKTMRAYGGGTTSCHRVAYIETIGPVPDGLQLDHLCRVRACCNPEHLEPVTNRENFMRGMAPAALLARANECHLGHSMEDAYVNRRTGHRRCRPCHLARCRIRDMSRPSRRSSTKKAAENQ